MIARRTLLCYSSKVLDHGVFNMRWFRVGLGSTSADGLELPKAILDQWWLR